MVAKQLPRQDSLQDNAEIGRLKWQCRRGIKEVEVILLPYFQRHYQALSSDKKAVFERLLHCHDVDLFEWFTVRSTSDDKEIRGLIDEIQQALAADAQTYQQ